jgi:hypothetical protein
MIPDFFVLFPPTLCPTRIGFPAEAASATSVIEIDQRTDPSQSALGVRHEVPAAQAHRSLGAKLSTDPFCCQIQYYPTCDRLPHRATFVVPHDTGLDIFFESLSKRSYYSPSVAYQVDHVQVYPGYHSQSERPYRRFSRVYDDGFPTYRTYGFEERARQSGIRPESG